MTEKKISKVKKEILDTTESIKWREHDSKNSFQSIIIFFVMQWHYLDLATERIRDAGRGRGRGRIVRRGLRKPARPSPADRKWEGVASARTAR